MIPSPSLSEERLFPDYFEYTLKTQFPTGAWPTYSSIRDGILNTAAGLLALKKHWNLKIRPDAEFNPRFHDAEKEQRLMLEGWDFQATD
ncbi:hypothetical protein F5B17DRAFT_413278 [Nemania serpens]|nr:hypothetical protein F5B17DRAFT_413278 [Nemania serpens]